MENGLRITKFVRNGKYLYFLTEYVSILGRINMLDGAIDYFLDTPKKIVDKPAYYFQLFVKHEQIYIIENSGKYIYRYDSDKKIFNEVFYDEKNTEKSETCAGVIDGEEPCWVLRDGRCIKWNVDKNTLTTEQLDLEHIQRTLIKFSEINLTGATIRISRFTKNFTYSSYSTVGILLSLHYRSG